METLTGSCYRAALLLALFSSAWAKYEPTYVAVGSRLDLNPPEGKTDGLTSILWKYNGNLVAEWVDQKVPLEVYGKFKGRTNLNITNGSLIITDMTLGDTGVYTLETNNRLQVGGYDVKVINKVPKPEVVMRPLTCSSTSENCTLTCEGDTTGAEPVTYSWKGGNGDRKETGKTFPIHNPVELQSFKTFSCRVKNPVSEGESDPFENPLFQEKKSDFQSGPIVGGIFGLLCVVALVGVGYWKREDIAKLFGRGRNDGAGQKPPSEVSVPLKPEG